MYSSDAVGGNVASRKEVFLISTFGSKGNPLRSQREREGEGEGLGERACGEG